MSILDDLNWRGLFYQSTDLEQLKQHLASGSRTLYAGFDPTADSLTIGHLMPMLMLRRFQLAGHKPIVVMGGGTGMIGDPSFKDSERQLLALETIQRNVDSQRRTFERVLDFDGPNAARITNNVDWLGKLGFLEALRDVGKHFSVNMMIQKESVRERLHNREQGISYTEFSYMLLQAYDFSYLFKEYGCTLQISGSDQWGNVTAGIDLIRRVHRGEGYGLTGPLITKADGTKFGKTETGAVWLKAERTSPYALYQFLVNTADADLPKFLKMLTLLERPVIEELLAAHERDPGARVAHKALAAHIVELLHGKEALTGAEAATHALFSGQVAGLPRETLNELFANAPAALLKKERLGGEGLDVVDLLIEGGVVKSKREAREFLGSGAILINGEKAAAEQRLTSASLLHGEMLLIRRGKKHWHSVRFED
ncbi:MAG TPA: tyrosine--tRNA ligase [Polyangiaceae bacterium]|nr:tyrosine--tRNA ligase [Polyangiaceae bacterium]